MTKEEIIDKLIAYRGNRKAYVDTEVKKAMDEYAKQQAVDFVRWAIENEKIMGDNWGDAFIPGPEDELYDQFIESQNKKQ